MKLERWPDKVEAKLDVADESWVELVRFRPVKLTSSFGGELEEGVEGEGEMGSPGEFIVVCGKEGIWSVRDIVPLSYTDHMPNTCTPKRGFAWALNVGQPSCLTLGRVSSS